MDHRTTLYIVRGSRPEAQCRSCSWSAGNDNIEELRQEAIGHESATLASSLEDRRLVDAFIEDNPYPWLGA